MSSLARYLVLATFTVLAGCSARTSSAAPPQAPQTETREPEGESAESKGKSDVTSVETTEEKQEGLEEKLDSSLREFDGLILREQEILEERREAQDASAGGGGGAGEGSEGEGAGAAEGDSGGENGGAEQGEQTADSRGGTGGSPDEAPGEPAGDGAPVATDDGELSNGRIPPDVGDGRDDDIVARQLREAAMNEEDPALREKLWDEYRAYKFGTKKPSEKSP
jgi:TolA-binding protein